MKNASKFNSLKLGLSLGMIVPVFTFAILYFIRHDYMTFSDFIHYIILRNIYIQVVTMSIVPNVLLFFLFVRNGYLSSARGTLIATALFTAIIFLLRFIVL